MEVTMADDSRRKLSLAIVALAKKKKIENISVSTLVQKADVNRSTFYYHFSAPMDVVRYMMDSFLEEFFSYLVLPEGVSSFSGLWEVKAEHYRQLRTFLMQSAEEIHFFYSDQSLHYFRSRFLEYYLDFCSKHTLLQSIADDSTVPVPRGISYDYSVRFLFAILFEFLKFWMERDFSEDEKAVQFPIGFLAGTFGLQGKAGNPTIEEIG